MEMFLSVAAISLIGVAVAAVLFKAAVREAPTAPRIEDERILVRPSRFFVDDRAPQAHTALPIEVLRLQIERHVRLEQAAAEAFRDFPTTETLRTLTTSPFIH
jgi:hypothetical protein